jgi:integrase
MARTINRLSARTVATTVEAGRYADGQGLYLYVDATGAKRWVFIFQWRSKRTEMGLGSATLPGGVKLTDARDQAEAARKLVGEGKNPIEERKRAKGPEGGPTFGDVADELIKSLRPGWKSPKHSDQWEKTFHPTVKGPAYAEALMKVPVALVSTDHVLEVLKPLWLKKPETAGKVRGRIERVLDAAKVRNMRSGENPARWRGHLDHLLPRRPKLVRGHQRAIHYDQAPGFMVDLKERNGAAARALEFTVLTVVRESEALGAVPKEFDLDAALWTIPGARMKGTNSPDHRVPLSPAAVQVVRDMLAAGDIGPEDYLFPGFKKGRPLSNTAMDAVLKRMKVNATPHGFRATFRDWAGDKTSFPREIAEEALAHVVGSEVERAYRRSDALEKRRKLMEAWARYLAAGSSVVELKRRSS